MARPSQSIEDLSPLKRAYLALEKTQARLEALEQAGREGIAVLGMGCRCPGGVNSLDDYWNLLSEGRDAITEVPPSRWDIDALYDPDPDALGKISSRFGGFLDNVDEFDAGFFGISPREAESLDPQQRLLLEVTQEAFEHAGLATDHLVNSQTGVFVGVANADYYCLVTRGSFDLVDAYLGTGTSPNSAAGRLSYVFGLRGPCTAIDTACSTSLVAIHLACQSLRNRECDLALAGGANVMLTPELSITFSKARMLSPDGRCKTFDASADGYVRGEGVGVIVLKRLSDALDAGDRILAVIRGSAINQDGPSGGLTVPNGPSQQDVIRRALAVDNIQPDEIDYVEAHGTGTALGDPIEMGALGAVFGGRGAPLWVGSVKTNLGHLEGAAGVAGVMKVILAMQHEEMPPHLHFNTPSPRIPWNELPVRVPTQRQLWSRGNRRRLAGVSSFGFSGINAHVVLEEAPPAGREAKPQRPCYLLPLSAKYPAALRQLAQRFASHLGKDSRLDLDDVCLTAGVGRSHYEHRVAVVAEAASEARQQLEQFARGDGAPGLHTGNAPVKPPKTAFLLSGQGSQYAGMGRELFASEPTFRAAFEKCEEVLRKYVERPLREVLFPEASDASLLDNTVYTQVSLFALEYCLAELWQSWGVRPAAFMGHSLGEYVAACLSGVFSLEDGLKLVSARGRMAEQMIEKGQMVAVLAEAERVEEALAGYEHSVSIAAVNGPQQVVISGLAAAVDEVVEKLNSAGVSTRRLNVSQAFHSPLIEPVLGEFRRVAEEIDFSAPQRRLVSNVSGQPAGQEIAKPDYWCEHARQPVQFSRGVEQLCEDGIRTFLEVGPQSTLLGLARACWDAAPREGTARWLGSLQPGRSDWRSMLAGLAELYVAGQAVDWERFGAAFSGQRISLPTYPYQRRRYWIDLPVAGPVAPVAPVADSIHPLLGRRVLSAVVPEVVQFESRLSPQQPGYLVDHQIAGMAILPATAYMEMALAAAQEAESQQQTMVLEGLSLEQSMQFLPRQARVVQVVIKPAASEYRFEMYSRVAAGDGSEFLPSWTLHATGRLLATVPSDAVESVNLEDVRQRCSQQVPLEGFYDRLRQYGLEYGPRFCGLQRLWRGEREVLGEVQLPETTAGDAKDYLIFPPLLDACLHVTVDLIDPGAEEDATVQATFVPVGVDRLRLLNPVGPIVWSHARLQDGADPEAAGQYAIDIDIIDPAGTVVAQLEGLRAQRVDLSMLLPEGSDTAGGLSSEGAPPPRNIADELRGLPASVQRQRIADFLEEEVVRILKLVGHDRPAHNKNLFEMGMDSLMTVEFLYRINRGLKINLPMQELLNNAAIAPLADRFVRELSPDVSAAPVDRAGAPASVEPVPESVPAPQNVWFPQHCIEPAARVRLFCFHPPGGSTAAYSSWPDTLRPEVEVCAVQLPGSGTRKDEPPIRDWELLVETLAEQMLDYLDRPFAFLGHGSGSLIAFDVAHFVQDRFGLAPVHLFVAASWAPSEVPAEADSNGPAPTQTSESTADAQNAAGPEDRRQDDRDGFRMFHFTPRNPLECSITAFAGSADERFGRQQLQQWYTCTDGSFRLELLPGTIDPMEAGGTLAGTVARELGRAMGTMGSTLWP